MEQPADGGVRRHALDNRLDFDLPRLVTVAPPPGGPPNPKPPHQKGQRAQEAVNTWNKNSLASAFAYIHNIYTNQSIHLFRD